MKTKTVEAGEGVEVKERKPLVTWKHTEFMAVVLMVVGLVMAIVDVFVGDMPEELAMAKLLGLVALGVALIAFCESQLNKEAIAA